jgi:hypothetical protein
MAEHPPSRLRCPSGPSQSSMSGRVEGLRNPAEPRRRGFPSHREAPMAPAKRIYEPRIFEVRVMLPEE